MKTILLDYVKNQSHINFWEDQLTGEIPVFELLPKLNRPEFFSQNEKLVETTLSENLFLWIHSYSKLKGIKPTVIFLSIFKILLNKYSGIEDIIVAITTSNSGTKRQGKNSNEFLNIIPIRTQCDEKLTFNEFTEKLSDNLSLANEYTDYSFSFIAENLNINQAALKNLFKIRYTFIQNNQKQDSSLELQTIDYDLLINELGDGDVVLEINKNNTSFDIKIAYNSNVYSSDIIQRLLNNYMVLLNSISEAPNQLSQTYSIITKKEKHLLLTDFNNTQFDYPKNKCIHHLFEENVKENPNQIAVVYEKEELSYQQLYDKCIDLALFLQSKGVKPDSMVGLCLERSNEMMIGIQGILTAGGAYVPLDPDYPVDRLTYMLENSQVSIVLCQKKSKKKLEPLVKKGTMLIALDEDWETIVKEVEQLKNNNFKFQREVKPNHLAYVIYTSGSTGKPKGVMVEHQALMNRIDWMQRMYPLNNKDIVLQKTPFSFDVSVWEFVWPMMAGASVVFAKPEGHKDVLYLENLIRESKVTTLHFVPSMLHVYLGNAEKQCNSVKQLFCSGEELDRKSVLEYQTRFPNAALHNLYGPTEAAIDVTFFDCSRLNTPFVPIGAPISNIQLYILDKYNNPLPIGVPGELHIAGDGLARGYLKRDDLTKEKFISNPFKKGQRMYKSGDLARWMENGNIEYLGRIDTQVKIRGFRIEIGEIETQLSLHPEISNSCVVVQGQQAEKKLIAFYQANETIPEEIVKIPIDSLKSHLLQSLPEYMVPAVFVSIDVFPVTPNGKMNRKALTSIKVEIESDNKYVAPSNEIERQLVFIWSEILNLKPEKIGVDDSFFVLGGDSLRVTQLISKIRSQLEVDLPHNAFFDLYTIASIAEVIETINYQEEEDLDENEFEEIIL